MKLKYIGKFPIVNMFGYWEPGDIKTVPAKTSISHFVEVRTRKRAVQEKKKKQKLINKRLMREELADKMERNNENIIYLTGDK